MTETEYPDSGFIAAGDVSALWQEITPLQVRRHSVLYRGKRYGRWFVLKGLPAEQQSLTDFRLQQEREFRVGIGLVHPNIAGTYSLEEVPGIGRCIVMESVDGQTLDGWLSARPGRQKRQRVLIQLLDAVEYLHARQLVHHDLKPGNILITRNGENVKLIDFGLSDSDDSATSAPNDIQADLLRIADLTDLLHLCGYKPVVRACRKGRYKNIAELRKGISRCGKAWKAVVSLAGAFMLTLCAVVGTLSYTRHLQAHEQVVFEQRKAAMVADVCSVCDRCGAAGRKAIDGEQYREFALMQLLEHCRYAVLKDSLNAVYPPDDIMINYLCNSELDKRFMVMYNQLQCEANAKPTLSEAYAAGRISQEEYAALTKRLARRGKEISQTP